MPRKGRLCKGSARNSADSFRRFSGISIGSVVLVFCDLFVNADTSYKSEDTDKKKYSRLEKAASYNDRDQEKLDRISGFIHESGNCEFCCFHCPNPANTTFDGPPDIWDHMEKEHPKEY